LSLDELVAARFGAGMPRFLVRKPPFLSRFLALSQSGPRSKK
jgi:hypothetical protein